MVRLVKILLYVVAAVVGIAVLASLAVYLFVDPNDYRENIAAAAKKATGRELIIEGDLSLSLFPWLAVEVGRTSLGNAEGFGDQPLLSFEKASVGVRLLPLIFGDQLAVGTATLESLHVNLAVNSVGEANWTFESATEPETAPEEDASAGVEGAKQLEISIGGITVSNASISYSDQQAGSSASVSALNFETGSIALAEPFDVEAEFGFESQPDGIAGQIAMSGQFLFSEDLSKIDIDGLNVSGNLQGIAPEPTDFNFDSRKISLDSAAETISLGEMDMGILGIAMTANVEPFSYAGDPQPSASLRVNEFSLKELMTTFGEEPPETADPNAMQRVSLSGKLAVHKNSLDIGELQLQLDDTSMTGFLSLPRSENGTIKFDLEADQIVVDHYMAPGSAEADAAASAATAPVEIPVDLIRSVNASGSLRIRKATFTGIEFDNLELGLNSSNGKLRMHPISADMFGGGYRGDVRIDATGSTPTLSVNENIKDVSLASLAKAMYDRDNINGTINGSFVLNGRGADSDAIKPTLTGNISFELADGELLGTDVWHQLRVARAMFKKEAPPEPRLPARTEFTTVSISGAVNNGILKTDTLLAELPFLRLSGRGHVNFVNATLDYRMDARVVETPEFQGRATEAEIKDFTSMVVPVRVSGPISDPKIEPDLQALAQKRVEKEVDKLKNKLLDRLRRRIQKKDEDDDGG